MRLKLTISKIIEIDEQVINPNELRNNIQKQEIEGNDINFEILDENNNLIGHYTQYALLDVITEEIK